MPASPDRFLLDFHGQGQYTTEHVVNDLLWRKSKVFCECLCGAVQRPFLSWFSGLWSGDYRPRSGRRVEPVLEHSVVNF